MDNPIEYLSVADPESALLVTEILEKHHRSLTREHLQMIVQETLWGLTQELALGRAIASGYAHLMGTVDPKKIEAYKTLVHESANQGLTLGRLMATHLVSVMQAEGGSFLNRFLQTVDRMNQKGTYLLERPLGALSTLLKSGNTECGMCYLEMLFDAFGQDMSYYQSRHFSSILPNAVLSFSIKKRKWQTTALHRVIKTDIHLADAFIEGMNKGLSLLSETALNGFVSLGLEKFNQKSVLGIKFFSLDINLGIETFKNLQVAVPFPEVQDRINRYLRARLGYSITARPISQLPGSFQEALRETSVCTDGKFIYLPDEISLFPSKKENIDLYNSLARIEAGHVEFGTFEFDLEKLVDRCRFNGIEHVNIFRTTYSENSRQENQSDLERFFFFFSFNMLARDLFTVFEHGRLRMLLSQKYPGIISHILPLLQEEAGRIGCEKNPDDMIFNLYNRIALNMSENISSESFQKKPRQIEDIVHLFEQKMDVDQTVESSAELVLETYDAILNELKRTMDVQHMEKAYQPLITPFGRKPRPDLYLAAFRDHERMAETIKTRLQKTGLRVYKSQIRKCVTLDSGKTFFHNIEKLSDLTGIKPEDLMSLCAVSNSQFLKDIDYHGTDRDAVWYKEWDCSLADYLPHHVRVVEKHVPARKGSFFNDTLERHRGLVKKIRRIFELLKPEGLVILRRWIEGDHFDYPTLLDAVLDKKAGGTPSERLYIKRLKQEREIAVLLLVDLSRSTANTVLGSPDGATVLDIEKEAIVFFCEALHVVGDRFAIAGFSGSSRLEVAYHRIKDFEEEMTDTVRERINALSPQRNTRMGAAIRHAAHQLNKVSAKIRLLLILSDGFPNDVDYKQRYAIEDTQKAIAEARFRQICVKAITINLNGNTKLDALYGTMHHRVISDVHDLPDKLVQIYSHLTKN